MLEKTVTTQWGKSFIHAFDDIAEFAERCKTHCKEFDESNDKAWYDFVNKKQAIELCFKGDDSMIGEAQKLLDQVDTDGLLLDKPVWKVGMAGPLPLVPSFLAGEPEHMLHLDREESQFSPVKVFVSTTSSASIGKKQFARRASAVLALTMILTQMRPVELWIYMEGDGASHGEDHSCPMVRVNTQPLDLSVAAYMLTHQGFTRGLMYRYAMHNFDMQGSWAFGKYQQADRLPAMRKALEARDTDLVIPGPFDGDKSIADPLGWLKDQLAAQSELMREAD